MIIDKKIVSKIKEMFKPGDTVQLEYMNDKQAPPPGTKGEIKYIDDFGTIHVAWENGSSVGLIFPVDNFKVISRKDEEDGEIH